MTQADWLAELDAQLAQHGYNAVEFWVLDENGEPKKVEATDVMFEDNKIKVALE